MDRFEFKRLREYLGLTQQQMADKLGVKLRSVAHYESPKGTIPDTIMLLMKYIVKESGVELMEPADEEREKVNKAIFEILLNTTEIIDNQIEIRDVQKDIIREVREAKGPKKSI